SNRDKVQHSGSSPTGGSGGADTTGQPSSISESAGHGYSGSTDTGSSNKADQSDMSTGSSS
ncbi:unnamed protein product, partial [Rotaria sp. Silwood1]